MTQLRELSSNEIDNVAGGIVPLIPIAFAFGKGLAAGAVAGGVVVAIADALDIGDFEL